jgi:hypothetical protein
MKTLTVYIVYHAVLNGIMLICYDNKYKKVNKYKKEKHKKSKKSKSSNKSPDSSSTSSSSSDDSSASGSDDSGVKRSVITGKKIKMQRDVTLQDRLQEIERAAKRHYMNSQY